MSNRKKPSRRRPYDFMDEDLWDYICSEVGFDERGKSIQSAIRKFVTMREARQIDRDAALAYTACEDKGSRICGLAARASIYANNDNEYAPLPTSDEEDDSDTIVQAHNQES